MKNLKDQNEDLKKRTNKEVEILCNISQSVAIET